MFRSDDSGDTWKQLPTTTRPAWFTSSRWRSIRARPTLSMPAPGICLINPLMAARPGEVIKNGIIDDSDIFAIDIDPRDPNHVIASACSGIYETQERRRELAKVQGIPSQSRRTRAILQHPSIPGLVFAGTTKASGAQNEAAMPTPGWSPLRDSWRSTRSPFILRVRKRSTSAPITTV